MNDQSNIVTDVTGLPWYQSTKGPQVSATVKALAGLIIPVLMNLGVVKTGVNWIDSLIDVACIVGFGGYALYGYVRAKKQLGSVIAHYKQIQFTQTSADVAGQYTPPSSQ